MLRLRLRLARWLISIQVSALAGACTTTAGREQFLNNKPAERNSTRLQLVGHTQRLNWRAAIGTAPLVLWFALSLARLLEPNRTSWIKRAAVVLAPKTAAAGARSLGPPVAGSRDEKGGARRRPTGQPVDWPTGQTVKLWLAEFFASRARASGCDRGRTEPNGLALSLFS